MRWLLTLAPLLCLCLQQSTPATSPKAPVAATPATVTPDKEAAGTKTFHSDAMHLTYVYPAAWQSAEALTSMMLQQQKSQASDELKKQLACMTVPVAAMDISAGTPQLVMMFRVDSGCLHMEITDATLAEFTKELTGGAQQSIPGAKFSEPQPYQLGGHAASVLHGSFPLPTGDALHLAVACAVNKPDLVCWQMMAPSDAGLAAIAANPVTFEGSPATAVVPASMFAAP